jgi:hypothetical protein
MVQFFPHTRVSIQRPFVDFPPHIWRPAWRNILRFVTIQLVIPTGRRTRCSFVWSVSELQNFFKTLRPKLKNQIHSGWCPFPGLSNDTTLVQIQSGRTVICLHLKGGLVHITVYNIPQRLSSCRKLLKVYGVLHIVTKFAGSATLTFAYLLKWLAVVLQKTSVTLVNTLHAALGITCIKDHFM